LLERGTFNVVLREEIPNNAPVMKGRFVLVIKNRDTDQEVYKSRSVVQGLLDPLKQRAVHNSPNLRQDTSLLELALATICGFEVWTRDTSQALLQAAIENMRDVFLQQPKEMELSSDEFLKMINHCMGCVIQETGGITLYGTTTCRSYTWSRLIQIQVCTSVHWKPIDRIERSLF
jgi:hypothetical protein